MSTALAEAPETTAQTPSTSPHQSPYFELETSLATKGIVLPRGMVDDLSTSAREMLAKWCLDPEYSIPSIAVPHIDRSVVSSFYRLQTPDDCVTDSIDAIEVFLQEVAEPELIDSLIEPLFEFFEALHKTDGFNESVDRFGAWFDAVYAADASDDPFPQIPDSLKAIVDRAMKSYVVIKPTEEDAEKIRDAIENDSTANIVLLEDVDSHSAPTTRQQAIDRLHLQLAKAQSRMFSCVSEHESAKLEAKNAKKDLDAAQSTLNGIVAELTEALSDSTEWQSRLDFEDSSGSTDSTDSSATDSGSSAAPAPTKDPAIEASIEQLAITDSMKEKLLNKDIATIKELEQTMAEDRLRKVNGIGESAIDKISDAVIAWRDEHGYGTEGDLNVSDDG